MSRDSDDAAMAKPASAFAPVDHSARDADQPAATGADLPSAPGTQPPSRATTFGYDVGEPPKLPPVLRSKIQPPPLRPTTLTRHRLLDRLPFEGRPRLTVVVADAGFGKTTLLADFSSRFQGRCLWYRLDDTDRDWITLVNYLIAAIRETGVDFGATTSTLLTPITGAPPSRETVLASLLYELQALGDQPTAVVIDDLQSANGQADDVLTRLLRDAPAAFCFILAGRRRPTLRYSRWSTMGEVVELTTNDLRFSGPEIERLFAESYGQPLEPEAVRELELRTNGWAAPLQLFHSLIRGRSVHGVRAALRLLSGATQPIYDYLAEEVLDRMPERLEEFVVRASILETITPAYAEALAAPLGTDEDVLSLVQEGESRGILSRASQASTVRYFHPLLREFLMRKLAERLDPATIAAMHSRVARVAERHDALAAGHHFVEAGEEDAAVRCLATSVLDILGTGRSGEASQLIDRLTVAPANPEVLAIQARGLMEKGDLSAAAAVLQGLDVADLPPPVRGVIRHARLTLAWRGADSAEVFAVLQDIGRDSETPSILRDIAQIYIDASPLCVPLPSLANRLRDLSQAQANKGHYFYAGVSLHNAAFADFIAGRFRRAYQTAADALSMCERLGAQIPEVFSTRAVIALCCLELGERHEAEENVAAATNAGLETADVHAELAYALATVGQGQRATALLLNADALVRQGKSDMPVMFLTTFARSLLAMATHPRLAIAALSDLPHDLPLDLGYTVERDMLIALGSLMSHDYDAAERQAVEALAAAERYVAGRCEVRLRILLALARHDSTALRIALASAAVSGQLALPHVADAVGDNLSLIASVPNEVRNSIEQWPDRWLPVLRRQLASGDTPNGNVAAQLLEEFGTLEDVGRLRAYARTYRRRGRASNLGSALARRVSPVMTINDLGRVHMQIGDRVITLTRGRRKPASVLMFLITKPNFTATREQAIEHLWPDSNPDAAANNLNQSLYFLRRTIDPWHEDGVAVDYIAFHSELLWLDPDLVRVQSAAFLAQAQAALSANVPPTFILDTVRQYTGMFCPEFEYEEWAIAWRLRVHAAFLQVGRAGVTRAMATRDLETARDIAQLVLERDPDADEIEQDLIRIYSELGAASAAEVQYERLAARIRADGLEPPRFNDVVQPTRRP